MTDTQKKELKAFDATVSFTFFGSWVDAISDIEEDYGVESAHILYKSIADYSMFGLVPDFDELNLKYLKPVWRTIANEIDNSIDRRKRGFSKETLTVKQQAVIDETIRNPSASLRDIAYNVGASVAYVSKTQKQFRKKIEDGIANLPQKHQAQATEPVYQENVNPYNTNGADGLDDDGELPF